MRFFLVCFSFMSSPHHHSKGGGGRGGVSRSLDNLTVDRNFVTTIDVVEEGSGGRGGGGGPSGTDQDDNEAVYGVVKIQVKKPPTQVAQRHGSVVLINSQKHSVPYCCTGKDFKSNEIRIVVNQRWV